MRHLFEQALETANLAKNIMLGYLGKHPVKAGETITPVFNVSVHIGYRKTANGLVQEVNHSLVTKLVEDYMRAQIEPALEYAVKVTQGRADTALIAAKGLLQDHLDQIAVLEAAQAKGETNV